MCDVSLCFVTFLYGVSGQFWYLIVSISGFAACFIFMLENIKQIFLSETTMPSTLLFGMQHRLVASTNFIQFRAQGILSGPACELARSLYESIGKYFCLTPQGIEH